MIYNGFIIRENAMTGKQINLGALTFGLDIGIASVGWAVLGKDRIIDLGVRAFDKAETAKEGESLNLARRMARLLRRRLRRRAWRLTKLARTLKREGVISDANLFKQSPKKGTPAARPWQLRVDALDRKLEAEEWARVIYHLCKHRGFHWISKAEEKAAESDSEGGRVKNGLAGTKKLMDAKKYRTAAEMVLKEFPDVQRNKHGDYSKALSRVMLSEELALLFQRQRALGNPHASEGLEVAILGNDDKKSSLFWKQEPALSGEKLLEMLGRCTFERAPGGPDGKGEYRAPKASFTAERHVWLTRLNNLRIVVDGKTRPLTDAERSIALPLPYETGELKYGKLRKALLKAGLSDEFRFAGLSYPSDKQKTEEKAKDPEDEKLVKLPGWQELRKTLKESGLETEWQKISTDALEGKPQLLDQIARVLTVYKEDEEVERELGKLDLPNKGKMVDALLTVRFDKFSNLSLKALYNILPHMEAGLRYDEACENAGYHHSQLHKVGAGEHKYLPPFYSGRDKDGRMKFDEDMDIPRNPVVLRALNQARKVVNALIRVYGSPHEVHIEMARDLSRPLKERKEIEKEQTEYRDRNDKDRELFIEQFGSKPKDNEFEKFRLYREQQGKSIYPSMSEKQGICAYSFEPIDIERLLEPGYVEIDHALPYQRSFDDSKNNRVLTLARENRNKGDMTPYEYLGGEEDSDRWRQFEIFVNSNKIYRQAKRNRLLKKDFGEKEAAAFRERNLNDTRYICRFFKNFVEQYLQLHTESKAKRCVVLSGSLTSLLRVRWGLTKVRSEGDRHHALDAVIVAACGHQVVKRLSTLVNAEGWVHKPEMGGYVQVDTGEFLTTQDFVNRDEIYKLFPRPWRHFRNELEARLKIDNPALLRAEMERLGTYPANALEVLRPLFVSRAPQRRNSGALHKETIYGKTQDQAHAQSTAVKRKDVGDLKASDLDKIVGANEPRNNGLVTSLRQWLKSQEKLKEILTGLGKGKAKREQTKEENGRINELTQLPRKPLKSDPENGPYTGPIIKKVKLVETSKSGAYVREGIAELGKVLRTRVFRHGDEYLFLPRYELPDEKLFGLPPIPSDAVDTGIELYGSDAVRIEHPNLIHCYKAIRTYEDDATGEKLIDVVAAFPSGVFLGYWAYFEPSNNRPVVQLHDSAPFYLLEASKVTNQQEFTLIAKEKKTKGDTENNKTYEYIEKSPPLERKAFKFSLEQDIKRQIGSAASFKKLHVDVLGNIYPAPPEKRLDLA
jgi:CRISPR-associated endonuclease Csn1